MGRKPSRSSSFFKVLIGDFHNQLHIPNAFIKNFDGKPPRKSNIRSKSGKCWGVEVEEDKDGFFFRSGWQEFVKHNSLEYGDFIVFKYNGKSQFAVKVFGKNACEKENLGNQATLVNIQECQPQNLKGKRGRKAGKKTRAKNKNDPREETGNSKRKARISNSAKRGSDMTRKKKLDHDIKKLDQVTRCAYSFKSDNWCFMSNIRGFYSRSRMTIPKKLVIVKNLIKSMKVMLRDPTGKLWIVELYHGSDGRYEMVRGWNAFCKGNEMAIGDTMIFEFIQDTVMQVRIFRAGAGAIPLRSPVVLDAANANC